MAIRNRPLLVSIVIPTHNRSSLLRLAVESVLMQTYPAVELIVVDDGSTDDTERQMQPYAGRLRYIKQANQGVAAARNAGWLAASGDYIGFLDDDDIFYPDKIERQVKLFDARPETDLVHCGYHFIAEDGRPLESVWLLPEGEVAPPLFQSNFIWVGAPLIRRHQLQRVGGFDPAVPSISTDWDLWLRLAAEGCRFACVAVPLGGYRIQKDSMVTNIHKLEQATFAVMDRISANPRYVNSFLEVKDKAYASQRFWVGCRFSAAGEWADAQRNLQIALKLDPDLPQDASRLLMRVCTEALGVRVADPLQFVEGFFDHLPAELAPFAPYRSLCQALVQIGLALKELAGGHAALAETHCGRAFSAGDELSSNADIFAEFLADAAVKLPLENPLPYAAWIFNRLPASAAPLQRVRLRTLAAVSIAGAFQSRAAGRRRQAALRALAGLSYQPGQIKNKGVLSLLLRSLPGLLVGNRPAGNALRPPV